jgi:hypothetical protein
MIRDDHLKEKIFIIKEVIKKFKSKDKKLMK